MLLNKAYIGLHLEDESEKLINEGLKNYEFLGNGIIPAKWLHLTLDYLDSIHLDTLEDLTFSTRVMLLLANGAKNSSPIILGPPNHILSDVTLEKIYSSFLH